MKRVKKKKNHFKRSDGRFRVWFWLMVNLKFRFGYLQRADFLFVLLIQFLYLISQKIFKYFLFIVNILLLFIVI